MNGRTPFPQLVLRQPTCADVSAIVESFGRSSPETIYRRFFTPVPHLRATVAKIVGAVDGFHHNVLVVLDGDEVIGTAQWDRLRDDPDEAEVAIAIEDRWQHCGLGRVLMRALVADAHRHGVTRISANVLADNRAARRFAHELGPAAKQFDGTEMHYTYALAS
jgi:RimJ/RimL family protein N-acetyltransferase